MRVPSFLLLLTLLAASSTYAQTSADIAAAAKLFGALPLAEDVRLSPDGNALSLIAGIKGRRTFAVWHLDGRPPTTLSTGSLEPAQLLWKGNDRLLASVYFTDLKNFVTAAGVTRLLTLNADGSGHRLVDFGEVTSWGRSAGQLQDRLLSTLPSDPDRVLIYASAPHTNLVTVNVKTSAAAAFEIGFDGYGWMVDQQGVLRLGEKTEYGEHHFYYRPDATSEWVQVPKLDDKEKEPIWQLAFSPADPNIAYMSMQHEDKTAEIYAVDLRDGSRKETIAAKAGEAAFGILYKDRLIGYEFGDTLPVYIDEQVKKSFAAVKKALPDHWVQFVDRSDDGQRYLFQALASGEGLSYWLLDLRTQPAQLRPLFQAHDDIPAEKVAAIRRIAYKARDGLTIPGLLTLPQGYQGGPIPFIVLPHGGPTAHDTAEFDYMTQFLASLGYGVLQPQFRGSDGYGLTLRKAGYGQWGRKMQDDIADGTRWLIEQGYADKARIAIAGFSYGGYAALMGGIRDPDLYACVVAGAPVADLAQFVDDQGYAYGRKTSIPDVKDPEVPLALISPVKRAREMKSPVLLMHGRLDFTVPVAHSEAMERQLNFYGRPVEAVYFDQADHYFGRESDRVEMLRTMGEFLVAHLPASK